jgi:hypothetical protein
MRNETNSERRKVLAASGAALSLALLSKASAQSTDAGSRRDGSMGAA